jgi:hypothetical protein
MRLAILAIVFTASVSGCAAEEDWIRVIIAGRGLATDLPFDTVGIDVLAAYADDASSTDRCVTTSRTFPEGDDGTLELPIELIIASGNDQWRHVAVRTRALSGGPTGDEVIRIEGLFSFPVQDVWTLYLDGGCLDPDPACPDREVCDPDTHECVPSLAHELFGGSGTCEEI